MSNFGTKSIIMSIFCYHATHQATNRYVEGRKT